MINHVYFSWVFCFGESEVRVDRSPEGGPVTPADMKGQDLQVLTGATVRVCELATGPLVKS